MTPATAPGQLDDCDVQDDSADDDVNVDRPGRLVAAKCVGCKTVRRKRAPQDAITDDGRFSFKHVCHQRECRGVTWWNSIPSPDGDSDGD